MIESSGKPLTETLSHSVGRIAGWLSNPGGSLSAGDVAALRRMDPRRPHAAFFKLSALALDEVLPSDPAWRLDAENRWAAIVVGLAHLGGLHRSGVRLGRALVESDFSELRFARLLRGDTDSLMDQLPMLGRFLAAKEASADWSQAAWLLLSAGRRDEESARRVLARDFYGAQAQSSNHSLKEGASR